MKLWGWEEKSTFPLLHIRKMGAQRMMVRIDTSQKLVEIPHVF
jgi:hypothetical protein